METAVRAGRVIWLDERHVLLDQQQDARRNGVYFLTRAADDEHPPDCTFCATRQA